MPAGDDDHLVLEGAVPAAERDDADAVEVGLVPAARPQGQQDVHTRYHAHHNHRHRVLADVQRLKCNVDLLRSVCVCVYVFQL